MRELLYVPIIHSEADLGRLGPAMEQRSASLYGEKRWAEHKETVARFWKSIADYLLSLDIAKLRIYQDGLAADGELGRRVVEEAARRGSLNHQLILRLLIQGALLRKTEDASLLLEELRLATKVATESSSNQAGLSRKKVRLTEERDKFIASTIDATLGQPERGVLFIGAYHKAPLYLPGDIAIEYLKDCDKVKAYFKELASGRETEQWHSLAQYLASPVSNQPIP